jgi:hypothetical protein
MYTRIYYVIRSKNEVLCAEAGRFLIKSYLLISAFNMSDPETNYFKFDLGISNDLASLLYLRLVSGDNNFVCRSSLVSSSDVMAM